MSIAEPTAADPLSPPRRRMTVEEFEGLPEDGIERMLIDGEVWEVGMTIRNRQHSRVEPRIARTLLEWLDRQPEPRGDVHSGEAGFRLQPGESAIGTDVAYASPELVARMTATDETTIYDGPPTLAVEVLSPSEQREATVIKVRKYLQAGAVVWEVEPEYQVVRVHRPGLPMESFNITQEIDADPYLPGYRVAVARFFR